MEAKEALSLRPKDEPPGMGRIYAAIQDRASKGHWGIHLRLSKLQENELKRKGYGVRDATKFLHHMLGYRWVAWSDHMGWWLGE